jgi:NDP-sugar pyrophosphorylase family protein
MDMQKINIFILAAGYGTRLQPISHSIPKPLLPIMGKPLLEHVLEKVTALPFENLGINLHYKRPLIESWINISPFSEVVRIFPEEKILNTGGALRNASDFISTNPFLVHNVDILSDISLTELVEVHNSSDNIATLAIHDYGKFNKLILDKEGFLKGIIKEDRDSKNESQKIKAFMGIALYSPSFIEVLSGKTPSVVTAWFEALRRGYKIGTVDFSGFFWSDLGTPESYFMTVMEKLRHRQQPFFIHPSVKIQGNVHIDDMVSIERECVVHDGAHLKNCILVPETKVDENQFIENSICGPSFKINIKSNIPDVQGKKPFIGKGIRLFLSDYLKIDCNEKHLSLISAGGSDRAFYRVRNGDQSFVLMVCHSDDREFSHYLEIARYLKKIGVPVAKTYKADFGKKVALIEDLGHITLYDKLKYATDIAYKEECYRKVLDIAVLIHTQAMSLVDEYPALKERIFDYEHARWETSYFSERFVRPFCGIVLEENSLIPDEFHRLAIQIDQCKKTIIHRDFQSQNIVIGRNNRLHIVDFQGARLGPPAYDLASILWDPYVNLDEKMREKLTEYYITCMIRENKDGFDKKQFRESLLAARLQRHMQALGAYGFLSLVKGKKAFLKFIRQGLELLRNDASLSKDRYPCLFEMVMKLKPEKVPPC